MAKDIIDDLDFFTDRSLLVDPYTYFDAMRVRGPVYQDCVRGVVFVTGFDEAVQVMNNNKDFSAVIGVQGPAAPLPFDTDGDDISDLIEPHRGEFYAGEQVVTYDDEKHSFSRSILNRVFTPSRLKASEQFIHDLADQMVREAVANGGCEIIGEIATTFVTLVVADLLGVPDEDRDKFRLALDADPTPPGSIDKADTPPEGATLQFMIEPFVRYLEDRQAAPRGDILTELALAKFPDGSTPELLEIVRLATFLFAAGGDTSAKLLGTAMRYIVDVPGLQQQLREDKTLVGPLIEEVLRLEGSTKSIHRLARRNTRIGDKEIPAGTKILVSIAAANRDPARWEDPNTFKLNRPRVREQLAFSRGAHTCIGAPLARAEVRIIIERFLEHTSKISLCEEQHGAKNSRHFDFEPSFFMRGLTNLHVKLKPTG